MATGPRRQWDGELARRLCWVFFTSCYTETGMGFHRKRLSKAPGCTRATGWVPCQPGCDMAPFFRGSWDSYAFGPGLGPQKAGSSAGWTAALRAPQISPEPGPGLALEEV